jgi:zinc/manganese transport system permease protein
MATSAVIGVIATWLGILLAYDSYYWPPRGHGWPVSFFIVAFVVVFYLLTYLRRPARPGNARAAQAAGPAEQAGPGERACSAAS